MFLVFIKAVFAGGRPHGEVLVGERERRPEQPSNQRTGTYYILHSTQFDKGKHKDKDKHKDNGKYKHRHKESRDPNNSPTNAQVHIKQ